ncbi:MAG: peptidase M28 [Flavobacteriales bacterium]|nr:peptidase M28 [Flavobacteriales bacterium]|tara:strand:+ start:949 stop:2169 length:1221 start_codon:yes stop_codon:yes gene_type:complete
MKKLIQSLLFLLISISFSQAQDKQKILESMRMEVSYLAADELEGRATGTQGETKAAEYIVLKFKEYNLLPKGEEEFFQFFEAKIRKNPHSQEVKEKIIGKNVVGYLNNNADETIIIGAHYDHVGYGSFGSLYVGEKEVHNGADDNASGVSILINLAKSLQEIKDYNYLFIAFSGEEHGLFGSSYYAKNPTIDLKKVRFMINFDMVGRLNNDRLLAINGVGTSNEWIDLINKSNKYDLKLKTTESGIGPSDHTSFYLQNIPSIHFFTGQHEDYHKPSDDVEKINFDGMYIIYDYVKEIINNSLEIKEFSFQETKSDTTITPRFKVTLGVMPDYLFDSEGMRIDGVSKGKTAYTYGILKGDIVLKMGEIDVKDMMSYMHALSQFNHGDTTIVKINRNSKIIETEIVFQ